MYREKQKRADAQVRIQLSICFLSYSGVDTHRGKPSLLQEIPGLSETMWHFTTMKCYNESVISQFDPGSGNKSKERHNNTKI